MGCSSSQAPPLCESVSSQRDRSNDVEAKPSMTDTLRENRSKATPSDVWLQASFVQQLLQIIREHPYLEPGCSVQPHPLQNWVGRCRDSFEAKRYMQAQEALRHLRVGLKAESRPVAATFRRFDVDESGHLDNSKFVNMCSYLGWDEEKTEVMDIDKDGRVTLQDMHAFVGFMGGVHQFFEKRRLRVTRSRKDVCDYSGIAVGASVRAYFYVRGQKSRSWREAVVREVGVARGSGDQAGPPTLGVSLEFRFAVNDKLGKWRAKQVVPMSWVIGGIEDASLASSFRQVGILDEEQSFWAVLLPDSEMHAMRQLESNQRAALALIRKQASELHKQALADVRNRFVKLGFGEREMQAVMGWVQDLAPIIIHVDINDCGHFFESDDYYRNQLETKTGKGSDEDHKTNLVRKGWENNLFWGLYDDAKPFERVKYGALDVMNDYRGVAGARRYGDSYLVLKDVRLRCTFTATDSAGLNIKRLGVLDKYLHVLQEYSDKELKTLIEVAMAAIAPEKVGGLHTSGTAELQLLAGLTEDSTRDWVTMGFPGLKQKSGRYYFEVVLQQGCCSPQVGLLSSKFIKSPKAVSAQGVGDDENGWAVDGQNSARWHGGCNKAWGTAWPCTGTGDERSLSESVGVGVAVDIDRREIHFSTNGEWSESFVFGPEDIPKGTALYPAVSLKGRADFVFGPKFRYAPPKGGGFAQWPSTPGGLVKVDSPEIGSSENLRVYKEVQIHGELSLKRNVQRLVASSKYREKPKTKRSYSLNVLGAGPCNGKYDRVGSHADMPLYKNSKGGLIYWDPKAALWRINDTEDTTKSLISAPPIEGSTGDVPRSGWKVPDEWHGSLEASAFKATLEKHGLASDNVECLMKPLTVEEDGNPKRVFKVVGEMSLEKQWQQLTDPPLSAANIWEVAVKEIQQRFLSQASLPADTHVVETKHPHEASKAGWKREVEIKGARGLAVYFASRSCTRDARTKFAIRAGGLLREHAGPGARIELIALDSNTKIAGTLVEKMVKADAWRVRLDRCETTVENEEEFHPKPGDVVEARYRSSTWYKAKVVDVRHKVDWYEGTRTPWFYTIDWMNGDTQDREKTGDQIRRPKPKAEAELKLQSLPRHALVPKEPASACYALCSENPKAAIVAYSGTGARAKVATVGDEITGFQLDRSLPLTPISVKGLAGAGPAGEKGVQAGWFLDLTKSVLGASRQAWATLLTGLAGGVEPDLDAGTSDSSMNKLLDAAFCDLDGLLERLNGPLRSQSDIAMIFTNSASLQPAKLLPEVHATFQGSKRVGSEVRVFKVEGQKVSPASFLSNGPAQQAGVSLDWALDLPKTRGLNPDKADSLKDDAILGSPNALLTMSNVTLVFKLPNLSKTQRFQGSGPADSERWKCVELPGCSAEFAFSTDGDRGDSPANNWGVWALVLSKGVPAPSRQTIDALAERWVDACAKSQDVTEIPRVEREGWDESRLRALCMRHGWEFEWMTEDGERRRRAQERRGFFQASGQLSSATETAAAAEASAASAAQAANNGTAAASKGDNSPADPAGADGAASNAAPVSRPTRFRFMTFNVEEYYHGYKGNLSETVLKNVAGIRMIFEENSPDIICLQEHSMGKRGVIPERDIMKLLVGGLGYGHVAEPTGEDPAWFSALANIVLWKEAVFESVRSWRVELASSDDLVPGTTSHSTARAATCVELKHRETGKHLTVSSTHLMGGRFEDKSFVAESMYGRCLRAEQVEKIAESVRQICGPAMPSIIAGDFNVMHHGYNDGSPFREGAKQYFEAKLRADAIDTVRPPSNSAAPKVEEYTFDGFYIPFQTKVHQVLDSRLGYVSAYGQLDDVQSMKTTAYAGCIDWTYLRNLLSLRDEQIVKALDDGLTDHNAVLVTLQLH